MTPTCPSIVPAAIPESIYPACAMLEYASIRLIFVCAIATILPRIIDAAARRAMSSFTRPPIKSNVRMNMVINAANAAAFTPVDINAVTGVGAPSYTSGAHMWNGTAATLNAKPMMSKPAPITKIGLTERTRNRFRIVTIFVVPAAP